MAKRKVSPVDFDSDDIPDVGYVAPPGERVALHDEPAEVKSKRPLRHSDIPQGVDPFRFIRENGYVNPTRKYRVTPFGKAEVVARLKSLDIEAVDESDAINQFISHMRIPNKIVHSLNLRAILVEG